VVNTSQDNTNLLTPALPPRSSSLATSRSVERVDVRSDAIQDVTQPEVTSIVPDSSTIAQPSASVYTQEVFTTTVQERKRESIFSFMNPHKKHIHAVSPLNVSSNTVPPPTIVVKEEGKTTTSTKTKEKEKKRKKKKKKKSSG